MVNHKDEKYLSCQSQSLKESETSQNSPISIEIQIVGTILRNRDLPRETVDETKSLVKYKCMT